MPVRDYEEKIVSNSLNMTDELRLEMVRATRNRMLYITDTLMQDDRPDVDIAALKAYRQKLRDLTKKTINADENGFPEITMPTKPQCVKDIELNFRPHTKDHQRDRIIDFWAPPTQ